ncbi:MAG: response regulator transcription factor [Chitinophagaceae bacterium]|jgi:DNA-binding NarL/FixJ family response regulator|nr:response regulator transcription factor [Chitinophagaceae bacterium]
MTKIALVDDHVLLRNGLASLINSFSGYTVIFEANSGKHMIELLDPANLPEVILLDITMPEMNGYESALWLTTHYPQIKIMALTMLNDERSIIRMFKNGAKGYLLKDSRPQELKAALDNIVQKGVYLNKILCDNIMHSMKTNPESDDDIQKFTELSEQEKEFLGWACTDKSYREIAELMGTTPKTIDMYRDTLFEKLQTATRVGLALFAIKHDIARL